MFPFNVLILTKISPKKKSFAAVFSASSQRDQSKLPEAQSH